MVRGSTPPPGVCPRPLRYLGIEPPQKIFAEKLVHIFIDVGVDVCAQCMFLVVCAQWRIGMSSVSFGVRFPVELVKRLDAARGDLSRGVFVRNLVADHFGWSPESKKTDSVVPRKDDEVLLDWFPDGPASLRKAREDLGWAEIRVEKAANKLANAGLVKFVGAGMVERK
jgi:hypothetical protein